VPTVVVLAVVLIAGSRMIALSVRHDAAVARETAAEVANTSVKAIEPLLQKLADLAERRAALAAPLPSNRDTLASLESLPPAAKTFWMTSDDKALGSRPGLPPQTRLQANGDRRTRLTPYPAQPFWVRCVWAASG
jgi:hypothetical protein